MPGLLQSHQIVFSTSLLSAFILLALLLSEGSLKYANLTSSAALLKPFNDVTAFRVKTKIFSKVVYKALCTLKGVSVLYSYHYSVLSLIFLLQSLDFFLDSPMCLAPFTLKAFVKKSPFARNTSSPHCLLNYSSFVPVRGITSQGSFTKLKPYVRARARVCVCVCVCVVQSCLTLCDLTDCSLPGSSVQGILQARILEWVVIPFSRGSSRPRDWARVSCTAGTLYHWATGEALEHYMHEGYSCFMLSKHLYFFFIVLITHFNAYHHNSYAYTVGIQQVFKWRKEKG